MLRRIGFVSVNFAPEGVGSGAGGESSPTPATPSASGDGVALQVSPSAATSSPSGAEAAPAAPSTPVAPAVAAPSEADNSLEDLLLQLSGGESEEAQPAPLVAPTEPAATPAAVTPAPAAEAAPPKVEPAATVAPATAGPQEQSPPLSSAEPAKLAAALRANESAYIDHLAVNEYKFTPEEVEAMGLAPEAAPAVGRVAATTHVRVMANVLNYLEQAVPQMFQKFNRVQDASRESQDAFFSKWPDIDRKVHAPLVLRFAQSYRAANPTATTEQMIDEVGAMVMVAAKVQPKAKPPGATNGTKPQGFVPAMSGPTAPPQPVAEEPWGYLDPNQGQ